MERGAITYLAQVRHSSYQRDSITLLQESLSLLDRNYLGELYAQHDVLLFHTGDFGAADQTRVLAPFAEQPTGKRIKFMRVPEQHWRLPLSVAPHLAETPSTNRSVEWDLYPRYSLGYRHMIRWYTIGLWETLERLGYTWVMRLDEDSRLLSRIPYNIFSFMASRRLEFGFRMASYESGFDGERFHSFVRDYLLHEASRDSTFRPRWLLDSCGSNATIGDFSLRSCGDLCKNREGVSTKHNAHARAHTPPHSTRTVHGYTDSYVYT